MKGWRVVVNDGEGESNKEQLKWNFKKKIKKRKKLQVESRKTSTQK